MAIASVVDINRVEHIIAEAGEVRPTGRLFERNVVGDDCDSVSPVGTDESVQVSIVGGRVLTDERRFAVAGSLGQADKSPQHHRDEYDKDKLPRGHCSFPPYE